LETRLIRDHGDDKIKKHLGKDQQAENKKEKVRKEKRNFIIFLIFRIINQ
jgi:hypothetical protein